MTGLGMLASALPLPQVNAAPDTPAASGPYIFVDEFDGPAGSAPNPAKWAIQNWQDNVFPPVDGIYRDNRENVFLDGNSNLVIRATKDDDDYYTGKVRGTFRAKMNTTWEARIKLDCVHPGMWPAFWAVNEDPLPDGEVDIFEWYGNGNWAPGTTVHAASNGRTWEGKKISGMVDDQWHTWRMHWGNDGFSFWRDYVKGAKPYLTVPNKPIHIMGGGPEDVRWPFNAPGYWMVPVFNLAVGGVGGGDPADSPFPASMLVDYLRIW